MDQKSQPGVFSARHFTTSQVGMAGDAVEKAGNGCGPREASLWAERVPAVPLKMLLS